MGGDYVGRGTWLENAILAFVLAVSTILFFSSLLMILLVPPAA